MAADQNRKHDVAGRIKNPLSGKVLLRDVVNADLPILFKHQTDPTASQMAAFPPRNKDAFMAHWGKILADDAVVKKTILFDGAVAGNVVSWKHGERREVGYWIGKEYWGKGIASQALAAFLVHVKARPLYAHVAKRNAGSIRVLEKCGFTICGEDKGPSQAGGEVVEEFIFMLPSRARPRCKRGSLPSRA